MAPILGVDDAVGSLDGDADHVVALPSSAARSVARTLRNGAALILRLVTWRTPTSGPNVLAPAILGRPTSGSCRSATGSSMAIRLVGTDARLVASTAPTIVAARPIAAIRF